MNYRRVNYSIIIIALIAIAAVTPALFINKVEAPSGQPWWNTSWQYRKAVTITTTASLTNYDVLVTLDTQTLITSGKMKSDGADIRFTDISNAELSYWIESPTINTLITRIWVNATSVSTSGTTIWMYYGNSIAAATSNGATTFSFFDDNWNSLSQPPPGPVHSATQPWWESTVSYPNVFEDTSLSGRPRYHMLYDGHNVIGHAKGYATSTDLNTWTEYDAGTPHPPNPNPILGIGYTGNAACAWGDPIKVAGTYYLYYSRGPGTTYRAESTDLISWINLQPIIDPTHTTTFGSGVAVLKEGDGITPITVDGKYWMIYFLTFGQGSMYLASSTDLLNWTPWSGNPLMTPTPGGWDSSGLWTPSFVRFGPPYNNYYIYYQGQGPAGWQTGYIKASAYSGGTPLTPDSTTWSKSSDAVLKLGASGSWDSGYVIDPMIRQFNGTYYVFYTGNVANGYAYSASPEGPWTKYNSVTPALWSKSGSPIVSGGIVTLGSGSSLTSTSTYLYTATGYRANYVGSSQKLKWGGFISGSAGSRTMFGTMANETTLRLKNYVSVEAVSLLPGLNLGSFHVYELLWKNGKSTALIDHGGITATLTAQVPTTALPITFYNYQDTTYNLQVDWIFVRPYSDPEPVTSVGAEENANQPPVIDTYSPTSSSISMIEGQTQQFTLTSHDPDGDTLTYAWLLDSVVQAASQNWTYTTDHSSVGVHNITVVVSDPGLLFASHQWTIDVVATAVYIDPTLTQKTLSDISTTFQANVMITGFIDLQGFDLNLAWDNSLITLSGIDFNASLDTIWGTGHWYAAKNESGAGYCKLVAVSTAGSYTGTGQNRLCALVFTVQDPHSNSERQTSIHFDTHKFSNSLYNPITHTVTDGTYKISGETPTLQMNPTSKTCRKYNETFTIQISLSNAFDVTDFEFEIHYNTTLLDYTDIAWNAWGSGSITIDEVNGNITGFTSGSASSGTQTLITLQFNATFYHIWKDENKVPNWKNDQSGQIYIQWANLSYSSNPDLAYVKGGTNNQINVSPDVTYTFSPIQGDVDNNGSVNVFDLRTVAAYYDQGNSTYDLNGDGIIDIFDLVVIGAKFGFTYP
jgi:hypothetical protein